MSANDDLAMSVSLLAQRLLIDFEWKNNQQLKKPNTSCITRDAVSYSA